MTWLAIITALAIGYIAGAMRAFAFLGFWCESLSNVAATLQPGCGGWWWGRQPIRSFFRRGAER